MKLTQDQRDALERLSLATQKAETGDQPAEIARLEQIIYASEPTEQGLQLVIPGCERKWNRTHKQPELF